MSFSYATTFSLIEWLAVTGLAQTVLILVYIVSRARNVRQALVPGIYFLFLAVAFALQFSLRLEDMSDILRAALWFSWAMSPALCYLLVVQVGENIDLPPPRDFLVLLFVPCAGFLALSISSAFSVCGRDIICPRFFDWLYLLGAMAGAAAMMVLLWHEGMLARLHQARGGRERYWLVLTLVIINVLVVVVSLLRSSNSLAEGDADAALTILGLAFVYLMSTVLFRVYPPMLHTSSTPRLRLPEVLSEEEEVIAVQARKLLFEEKIYQEPGFSRADLARELKTSEAVLSRVINVSFGKSFPQLLNELRVDEAKIMLQDPALAVQVIAAETGFNSIASFNRVFKDIVGVSPSGYRQNLGIGVQE